MLFTLVVVGQSHYVVSTKKRSGRSTAPCCGQLAVRRHHVCAPCWSHSSWSERNPLFFRRWRGVVVVVAEHWMMTWLRIIEWLVICCVCHWSVLVISTPVWDDINAIFTFSLCFSCCGCYALLHISIVTLCLLIWSTPCFIDVICYMWNDSPGTPWTCTSPLVCTHMKGASASWMVRYVWNQVIMSEQCSSAEKILHVLFLDFETNVQERDREYHFK